MRSLICARPGAARRGMDITGPLTPRHEGDRIETAGTGARSALTAAGGQVRQSSLTRWSIPRQAMTGRGPPHIGEADLCVALGPIPTSPPIPAGEIGILGSRLSAIDVIVDARPKPTDLSFIKATMCAGSPKLIATAADHVVSHKGIMARAGLLLTPILRAAAPISMQRR